MFWYLAILVASLVSCGVGFALEIVNGNICHVLNSRPPEAGVALFPTVPIVPSVYVLVAWSLNQSSPNVGFLVVAAYALCSVSFRLLSLRNARAKLQRLLLSE